ncbi:AraC-type DNA-binding protein [Paenibacillaceae bacterium GAS479]|nr:AraC-type DNA-binding protein [Paenibacillaceae bacterium GAS479]
MNYIPLHLKQDLQVDELISLHYFEYPKGFLFEGESHDFWELLYVDKGEVEVRADDRLLVLQQGTIVFHKPGEFHTVRVDSKHRPPNLIVIAFTCSSPLMEKLHDRVDVLQEREVGWLSILLQEGFASFLPPFHDPQTHQIRRNPNAPPTSEQMFRLCLELLLISQIRSADAAGGRDNRRAATPAMRAAGQDTIDKLKAFMGEKLGETLTLEDLCQAAHLGRTRLKELVQLHSGMGPMELFRQMKLEEAKSMIRERSYSMTEISAKLGYSSLHYFSRDFKRATGMPPSEYARTVEALLG